MGTNKKAEERIKESSVKLGDALRELQGLDLTSEIERISETSFAEGGYCNVHKGFIRRDSKHRLRGKAIVVRIMRSQQGLGEVKTMTNLANEIVLWNRVKHKNCLPLEGFCIRKNVLPSFITEYMECGTVLQYITEKKDVDVRHLALGIAEGVEYLHLSGIIHADLKSSNVLVSRTGNPLVCDFGLSRIVNDQGPRSITTSTGIKGSVRWMARELFEEAKGHTKASDVWAYGMTLLELMTKKPPFDYINTDMLVIKELLRGKVPVKTPSIHSSHKHLWSICRKCWSLSISERPSMRSLISLLQQETFEVDTVDLKEASSAVFAIFQYAMVTVSNAVLPSFLMQHVPAESPDEENAVQLFLNLWKKVPSSKSMVIQQTRVCKEEDLIVALGSNNEDNSHYVFLGQLSTPSSHFLARQPLLRLTTTCIENAWNFEGITVDKAYLTIAFICTDNHKDHSVILNWQTGLYVASQ